MAPTPKSPIPISIAFKAHLGWMNVVAVDAKALGRPKPLLVERLPFFEDADRETREPYHVAGGWEGLERVTPPADPAAIIKRARKKQEKAATKVLGASATSPRTSHLSGSPTSSMRNVVVSPSWAW